MSKIFIVHVFLGCCANNSDGKLFIIANTEDDARRVATQATKYPITIIESYFLNNEVVYSSFKTDKSYRLQNKTDNWGYLPEQYVSETDISKTFSESWQRNHSQ